MRKFVHVLLVVVLVSLVFANVAFASHGEPVAGCGTGFELHHLMDHTGDPMHDHIGVNQDLNGDGYVCVKHISPTLHLHVDNSVPLK